MTGHGIQHVSASAAAHETKQPVTVAESSENNKLSEINQHVSLITPELAAKCSNIGPGEQQIVSGENAATLTRGQFVQIGLSWLRKLLQHTDQHTDCAASEIRTYIHLYSWHVALIVKMRNKVAKKWTNTKRTRYMVNSTIFSP